MRKSTKTVAGAAALATLLAGAGLCAGAKHPDPNFTGNAEHDADANPHDTGDTIDEPGRDPGDTGRADEQPEPGRSESRHAHIAGHAFGLELDAAGADGLEPCDAERRQHASATRGPQLSGRSPVR